MAICSDTNLVRWWTSMIIVRYVIPISLCCSVSVQSITCSLTFQTEYASFLALMLGVAFVRRQSSTTIIYYVGLILFWRLFSIHTIICSLKFVCCDGAIFLAIIFCVLLQPRQITKMNFG